MVYDTATASYPFALASVDVRHRRTGFLISSFYYRATVEVEAGGRQVRAAATSGRHCGEATIPTCSAPRTPTSVPRRYYGPALLQTLRTRRRVRHLGFAAIQRRLPQATDHVRGRSFQGDSRSGQSQPTLLRLGMPCPLHTLVRAPMAVVRQDGLRATSPQDKSWRSMSGGPGEPSGVTWRARGRPPGPDDGPDAQECANAKSPGRERG